jgi:hypothetical protein
MMTETGLPASPCVKRVLRHPPAVRAPRLLGQRRPLPPGSLRRLALGILAAWALGVAVPAWTTPARASEARSAPAPRTGVASAHTASRQVSGARREAHARAPVARPNAARASRERVALRATGGVISDGARMRDAPQELVPVLAPEPRMVHASPRSACLAATQRAEEVHGLPRGLLTAIALAESGLHAYALSIGGRAHFPEDAETARRLVSQAPAGRSIMAGCVQVNARVHARHSHWPLDPYVSADWAGGILARWHREKGSWSEALRRWHGGSPASTQRLVCRVKAKLEITSPGSDIFDHWRCDGASAERVRRTAAIHLATAERHAGR